MELSLTQQEEKEPCWDDITALARLDVIFYLEDSTLEPHEVKVWLNQKVTKTDINN